MPEPAGNPSLTAIVAFDCQIMKLVYYKLYKVVYSCCDYECNLSALIVYESDTLDAIQ